jgi:hypothetical protein
LIEENKRRIPEIFAVISTPDEWDKFIKDKTIETKITDDSNEIKRRLVERLIKSCENTYNLAILRIQEYSGLTDAFSEQSLPGFHTKINGHELNRFTREKSDIEGEEARLLELQSQKKADEDRKSRLLVKERKLKEELSQKRQRRNRVQSDFDSSKRRLGQMPEAESYYVDVTDYEYRGGIGLLDALFGPKEVIREEERYDYSAQEQWKDQERRIKNEFTRQNTDLNIQLRSLEDKISDTKQQIAELDKTANANAARINREIALVNEMVKSLQVKRTLAAQEYVQRQKDELKNSVCGYLDDTLQPALTEMINNEAAQMKDNLCREIRELYIDVSRGQKENLKQLLSKNRSDYGVQYESLKRDMDDILAIKNELEVYLCKQQTQTY